MPRALAIETTSRRGQAALVENGRILAQDAFAAGLKHTAELLPLIDRLCRARAWRAGEIDQVYVSVGPGGFTGMRIGVTFAKTFAFATGAKVVAVPTPRVLVENAPAEARHALVIIDARRGKVWAERFERAEGQWRSAERIGLTTMTQVLGDAPRPIWLVGEGVAYHADAIDSADAQVHLCPEVIPRVEVVADIGAALAGRGRFTDPFALAPVYVRRPEAEEKRRRK